MRFRFLSLLFLAAAVAAPLPNLGCAEHHYYRVYDTDHGDYHRWDDNEIVYYQQWETENHKDHRDFRKRGSGEQKEYWNWRHRHSDHDHDKDRDRDKH
jgi:hypothetical protein